MCGHVAALGRGVDLSRSASILMNRGIRSRTIETIVGTMVHVRLPIVGVKEEFDQPMSRPPWTIGFVGEVLDFRDWRPKSSCDAPMVADLWEQYGPRGLLRNDGFWSILALNSNTGCLHVLCDYLAQKPTYYRADAVMAAASDLDSLVVLSPVTIDEVYLSAVIKWGYCPDPTRTPYQEIKHVLPGEHVIIYPTGKVNRQVIDTLEPTKISPEVLKAEIEAAVRRRVLSSDVPISCLLSGGVDSSIVYTLATRYAPVTAYYAHPQAIQVPIIPNDEEERVEAVSKGRTVTRTNWSDVKTEEAVGLMQEPVDLGSLIPQVALSRIVRERVCLTGDGADEVFGGYGRNMRYDSQMSDIFQELVCWHLPRLDRIMAGNCIEVRTPFLARRVVEGAMGLPWEDRRDKMALRRMFKGDLPESVAFAPKIALRTAKVAWNREEHSEALVQIFRERISH